MKAKIEQFIDSWTICMEAPADLKLGLAIETILRTIDAYLQQHTVESKFQEAIHFALQKSQALPRNLRFKTLSYLNGGIQREVQRPEYQQLKNCFIKHLKPASWSSYGVFIAAEVLPPILLILMIASMPGLALAAKRSKSASSEGIASPCTHLLQIDYAKSNTMLQGIKLQMSKMGVDYNKLPLLPDFGLEKIRRHADCFAQTLTQFCVDDLQPREEEKFLNTVLNDDTYMEPLYLILTYAQNEPLRYKIIARLSHVLYLDIKNTKAFNANRLIRILGQAIMAIHPDKLPSSITKDAIIRMADILSLYRRRAQSESAVNKQSLALRALLETGWGAEPQSMPVKENSYYIQFLVVFAAMMGLVQIFTRLFNHTLPTPKVHNQKTAIPEQTSAARIPLSNKPLAIKPSPQIAPSQIIVKAMPVQASLSTILTKLNELFSDLVIHDSHPLCWSQYGKKQVNLLLRMQQYYYNTQGKGKVFGLSKAALSALIKEYCRNRLGSADAPILLNDADLVLEQPWGLKLNENTHSIKQSYAAFFKILRQLANVYFPMDLQLDYYLGEFFVVFSLNKEAHTKIEPYSLIPTQFLQSVHRSLNLSGQEPRFTISYQALKDMPRLPNEKEFLAIKKADCTKKEKELTGQASFFNRRVPSSDFAKNSAMTPLKTAKNG